MHGNSFLPGMRYNQQGNKFENPFGGQNNATFINLPFSAVVGGQILYFTIDKIIRIAAFYICRALFVNKDIPMEADNKRAAKKNKTCFFSNNIIYSQQINK